MNGWRSKRGRVDLLLNLDLISEFFFHQTPLKVVQANFWYHTQYIGGSWSVSYFDTIFLGGRWLWFFCFIQNFFFRKTQELEYLNFCRAMREFFFQNITLGYMTKTLNQNIFFFLHQNQNIFFSNIWESEYFFRKKP